jgi:hypothetical protein
MGCTLVSLIVGYGNIRQGGEVVYRDLMKITGYCYSVAVYMKGDVPVDLPNLKGWIPSRTSRQLLTRKELDFVEITETNIYFRTSDF